MGSLQDLGREFESLIVHQNMNRILECQQFLDGKILCLQEVPEPPRMIHPDDVDISTVIIGPVLTIISIGIGLAALRYAKTTLSQGVESIKQDTNREQSKDYAEGIGRITRLILQTLDSIEPICKNCGDKSSDEFRELLKNKTSNLGKFLNEYERFLEKITEQSHSVMISESYLQIENKIDQIDDCIVDPHGRDEHRKAFRQISDLILSQTVESKRRHVGITKYLSLHASATMSATFHKVTVK